MCGALSGRPLEQEPQAKEMKTYLSVYFGSLLLAVLITPVVIITARALNIYDDPNVRKIHASAIPRIGGVVIFVSAIVLVIAAMLLENRIGQAFRDIKLKAVMLLIASGFVFLVGFIDDLKGLRVRYKLIAQVVAALSLTVVGVRIDMLNFAGLFTLHFGWLSFPITIFWIVAITNAVNIIDGLDGLAAGISAVACAVIAVFAFDSGRPLMAVLMLALLGSLTGFLFFNFNPARIFMGDSGSMFLGFTLASASVMCAIKSGTIVALALPALALGLPIFDTIFSMLRRYLGRRGIMSPDRGHLHHMLLDMGLRHRHVVIVMYALTVVAAGLGMFMMLARRAGAVAIFFLVVLLLVLVFRAVGAVQFRQMIADLKRKHTISQQAGEEIRRFENLQLHFHRAQVFRHWWQAVCFAADSMDIIRMSLPLTNRDGSMRTLTWARDDKKVDVQDVVDMTFPVRDRRAGSVPKLAVKVHTNGSLESATRRAALFTRLIEEHNIASLPGQVKDVPGLELEAVK